jgi:hypothetical protein
VRYVGNDISEIMEKIKKGLEEFGIENGMLLG